MKKYRILALDGGGIRGLLTITLLRRLEETVPGWIDQIDMVAGTSTGAIIAIGLAGGVTPEELFQHYYYLTEEIFKKTRPRSQRKARKIFRPEYDTEDVAPVLRSLLGETRLCDLQKKILITTFELDNEDEDQCQRCWEPRFFHNLDGENGSADLQAYKAILYSSATPVYFPSVDGFIDGAVTAQNPSLVALAHAVDETIGTGERPKIEDIVLLSIGCGKDNRHLPGKKHNWGYAQWTRLLVDMMLEGSVDLVDRICRPLLRSNYHRLCPGLSETIHANEWEKRDKLAALANGVDIAASSEWLRSNWLSEVN